MVTSNRRQLERFNLEVPARLEFSAPNQEGKVLILTTSNICAGGAFFRTFNTEPEGVDVNVEIELPIGVKKRAPEQTKILIRASGRVIRTDSSGMAVWFESGCELLPTPQPKEKNEFRV